MPAANCTNPIQSVIAKDNGRCTFTIQAAWDGVSVPPFCEGTPNRVFWENTGTKTFYAHLIDTRLGPAVYRIDPAGGPSSSGDITSRPLLSAAGLDSMEDVRMGFDLTEQPPQPGERLLN